MDTGYSAAEVLGRNPRFLQSGLTPAEVHRELWRTIKREEVFRGELVNRTKSGDLVWLAVTISPVRNPLGGVTNYLSIQEDITARKAAERNLLEREERFRQLAEHIREVFYLVTADYSEMLYINPAYEDTWGRSCQSLYDNPRSFLDAVHPEDVQSLMASIARTQAGQDGRDLEFRIIRPDGDIRWILSHTVAIRNEQGEIYRISGVALDITDRHNTKAALREREALFRGVIETSFDGIAFTEGGILREANQGFAKMFGYTLDELIGRSIELLIAPESLEEVRGRIAGGVEGTYEMHVLTKDGRKLQLEATARSHIFQGRSGRLTALRDLTEKRQLEEQFRQAQKMEAVGRLAGGIAHDFNNMLTVISSYSELLLLDMAADDARRQDLEAIQEAAAGAARLTGQLLAFSRRQVIEPRMLTFNEVVTSSAKILPRLIGEDVELVTTLDPHPATVKIDPSQLEQVIMNLAVNARDAMPTGGRLTIETGSAEFDEGAARTHWPAAPGRYAMLMVSDTGIGMDQETQARVFEPFFTTKAVGKGTGLGLSTVYGIVNQSGGFIWVYSEPGQGTTFKIYLPRQDAAAQSLPTVATGDTLDGHETVLLSEDSAAVRAVACEILKRHGYTVLEAARPEAALELAATHAGPIHLLLTDVVMPGMSGRELAQRFREQRPEARVLYMSGYTDDTVVRHGVLEAGTAFLQKPFSLDSLARKVREVLDQPAT